MIFLFWRIYRFVEAAAAADRVSARIWRVTIETHQQYFSLCLHIWGEEVTFGEMDFLGSSKLSLIGRNTFPILVPASEWRRRGGCAFEWKINRLIDQPRKCARPSFPSNKYPVRLLCGGPVRRWEITLDHLFSWVGVGIAPASGGDSI